MATVPHGPKVPKPGHGTQITWTPLTNTNQNGQALAGPGSSDKSVHAFGAFGGATITMQGSNEDSPTNWATLHDTAGNDLTFTALGTEAISENMLWIRPLLSGGAASSVTVIVVEKGNK